MNIPEEDELPDDASNMALLSFVQKNARALGELWGTVLGYERDSEAHFKVTKDNITRLHIQMESAHPRIGGESNLKKEHVTVWGALWEILSGTETAKILDISSSLETLMVNLDCLKNGVMNMTKQVHLLSRRNPHLADSAQ